VHVKGGKPRLDRERVKERSARSSVYRLLQEEAERR